MSRHLKKIFSQTIDGTKIEGCVIESSNPQGKTVTLYIAGTDYHDRGKQLLTQVLEPLSRHRKEISLSKAHFDYEGFAEKPYMALGVVTNRKYKEHRPTISAISFLPDIKGIVDRIAERAQKKDADGVETGFEQAVKDIGEIIRKHGTQALDLPHHTLSATEPAWRTAIATALGKTNIPPISIPLIIDSVINRIDPPEAERLTYEIDVSRDTLHLAVSVALGNRKLDADALTADIHRNLLSGPKKTR